MNATCNMQHATIIGELNATVHSNEKMSNSNESFVCKLFLINEAKKYMYL